MLATVVVTLCLASGACIDKIVTREATMMQCGGAFGEQAISQWMENNGYTARGYRLARWRCTIGQQRIAT